MDLFKMGYSQDAFSLDEKLYCCPTIALYKIRPTGPLRVKEHKNLHSQQSLNCPALRPQDAIANKRKTKSKGSGQNNFPVTLLKPLHGSSGVQLPLPALSSWPSAGCLKSGFSRIVTLNQRPFCPAGNIRLKRRYFQFLQLGRECFCLPSRQRSRMLINILQDSPPQ